MNTTSESPCDDMLWSLENCPRPAPPDPCCNPARMDPPVIANLVTAAVMILGTVGIFGNMLNIIALPYARKHCKDIHSPLLHFTTILIISLSVCDLFFIVGVVIARSSELAGGWQYGWTSCTVVAFGWHLVNANSMLHLDVMAVSRCLGLWFPRIAKVVFDSYRGIPVVAMMWAVSSVVFIPVIYSDVYGYFGYNPRVGHCTYYDIIPAKSEYMYAVSGLQTLAPMVFIPVSSILIFIKARKSSRQVQSISSNVAEAMRKRERRLTTIFVVTSAVYIACVIPFFVTFSVAVVDHRYRSLKRNVIGLLYTANFAVNFIMYALRVPAYRDAYLLLFRTLAQKGGKINGILRYALLSVRNNINISRQTTTSTTASKERNPSEGQTTTKINK